MVEKEKEINILHNHIRLNMLNQKGLDTIDKILENHEVRISLIENI